MSAHAVPIAVRKDKQKKALIFIHGFSGSAHQTFGMFPAFLAGTPALYDWDIYCFGYATSLSPDVSGIWTSDPDLSALAVNFTTAVTVGAFAQYTELAVIAHSMGGLLLQRAILDGDFESRVKQVFLFGVPSAGVKNKASLGSWLKKQAKDMVPDGPFITTLRKDWNARYTDSMPFELLAIAGLSDDFVLGESSQAPFAKKYWRGVSGNHVEMVKPESADYDSVLLVLQTLSKTAHSVPSAPDRSIVNAALLMEKKSGTEVALQFLNAQPSKDDNTDVMGAIGGRHKRLWMADPVGHAPDGNIALDWYQKGYALAKATNDSGQTCYHGINIAFLQLALLKNPSMARTTANSVLAALSGTAPDLWVSATRGEAYLYLGDVSSAVAHYQTALDFGPTTRQVGTIYQQAIWVTKLLEDPVAEHAVVTLFANWT